MKLSDLKSLASSVGSMLCELHIHCDNAGESSLLGCPKVMALSELCSHCKSCLQTPRTPQPAIVPSSTVADVLTAPRAMLQGDVSNKLLSHLINHTSDGSTLQQHTGGPKKTWQRVVSAKVASQQASTHTRETRTVANFSETATVRGAKGASAQLAHSTRVMSIEYRTALLKEAGVLPSTPASGVGLAIKSDMNPPWNGLRNLRRYLKEFGVKLESEHVMRKQISKELPFDLLAEEVPLFDKNGSISMCPVVCFVNLIEVILHYISLNHKAGTLTWRDGSLPEDQIWVKLGGDHGGESFKFCFQIVNVSNPNALVNTVPFLVFCGKDTPSNLQAVLERYIPQLLALKKWEVKWHEKTLKVPLFGDYEFLTKSYGLSGSSGVRPCLFCLATKADIQTARDADDLDQQLARCSITVSSSESFDRIAKKQKELEEKEENYSQANHQASLYEEQLQWTLHQANEHAQEEINYLYQQWSHHEKLVQSLSADVENLRKDIASAKVKHGPCASSFEPVLKLNRIERQVYHSGAFIGNHVHKALEPGVTRQIVSGPLALLHGLLHPPVVLGEREYMLLGHAMQLKDRYSNLFSSYVACRCIFSTCQVATGSLVRTLQDAITVVMHLVRREVTARHKKTVTPKLHLLEQHTVSCIQHFGVCLGVLGEQGGEAIHHKFNQLKASLQNMPEDVDRLRVLVDQYLTSTTSTFNSLSLCIQPKKRKSSS